MATRKIRIHLGKADRERLTACAVREGCSRSEAAAAIVVAFVRGVQPFSFASWDAALAGLVERDARKAKRAADAWMRREALKVLEGLNDEQAKGRQNRCSAPNVD